MRIAGQHQAQRWAALKLTSTVALIFMLMDFSPEWGSLPFGKLRVGI
jgi:hypothetical protein